MAFLRSRGWQMQDANPADLGTGGWSSWTPRGLWQEGPRPLTSIQTHCFPEESEAQESSHFPQLTQFSQVKARTTDKFTVDFTSLNSQPRNLVSRKQKDYWWQSEGLDQFWRLSGHQPKLLEPGSRASLPAVGRTEAAQPSESPRVITGGLCT